MSTSLGAYELNDECASYVQSCGNIIYTSTPIYVVLHTKEHLTEELDLSMCHRT